jgi:CPA1 family monovalent cation:H+ antiporter
MKHGLKLHISQYLKRKYAGAKDSNTTIEKFVKLWEDKAKASDDSGMSVQTKALFMEVLETQRQYLVDLNKDPDMDEELIREQLYQIDLEEERLKMV